MVKICGICNKEFYTNKNNQKYCCLYCSKMADYKSHNKYMKGYYQRNKDKMIENAYNYRNRKEKENEIN